ncbi:MAG TPA: hypothetical protein VER08_04365 [Pyrinomonadaceae bacterium]|nr:hypothetical protein [Pyrinomonadaceae bacterium]
MGGIGDGKIVVLGKRHHHKASEVYVDVVFNYPEGGLNWSIPIEYRRTGTHLKDASDEAVYKYLLDVYEQCRPSKWAEWRAEQEVFWAKRGKADITKSFFDVLEKSFTWHSVASAFPANPNFASRIKQLKDFGYTIATDNRIDRKTNKRCTHLLLIPLPKGGISGYESWSSKTRDKIMNTLQYYDAYEARFIREGVLPDHKFPEIRWDESTRRESLEELTEEEIKRDFQLLNNQRNQQKREACRRCYQTNKRGYPFGIKYYHKGTEDWPADVPPKGKSAEAGCVGCGWYDLEAWRQAVIKALSGG